MKNSLVSKFAIAAASLVAATALAELPDKWVSYVESTGTQWVDTEIIGRPNTKIEAKVEWMDLADSAFVACGLYSNNTRFYMCYCGDANGNMLLSQRTNVNIRLVNKDWYARFEKNRVYNYVASFSATNSAGKSTGTVTVDGLGPWSTTFTGLNTGRSLYVFANNSADGTVGGRSKTRCYGLKIWQGPEDGGDMALVRDFQPCMKGDKAGLYDAVSGDIFYSISGTDLICDESSEEPDEFIDYVESQGDAASADGQIPAYIDTGIIGKAGTTAEFKETCLRPASGEYCVLGARSDSNTRFFMWYHANGAELGLGYGTLYWRPNTTNPDATASSGSANVYKLNNGDTTHALVSFAANLQTVSIIDDGNGSTNLVSRQTLSANVNTGKSLYVFARNNNGSPDAFSASRLYGLKIWQGGDLVRDFRPCLKNGVAGLYDDVSKRIFYSLGTPFVYNNVHRQNVKPQEVVFVEYIESDGNNTLDTGVPARSGTRAKGVMMWTAEDENGGGVTRTWDRETYRYLENTAAVFWRQRRAYLGARNLKDSNAWFHMLHESNAVLLSQYGNGGETNLNDGSANVPATVGVTNSFDVTFADGSQTMEWNGTQVLNATTAGSIDTGNNLCLFSSSHWRWRSAARCYGLKIWRNGILVRDFRPCKVDGKGMLYDTVTDSIYRPSPDIPESRTGNVVAFEDEKPVNYVDYVETDGKVFFDTGVIGKAATIAEFKETSMQKSSAEECFLGSYGGSPDSVARCYMWYHAYGYNVGLGYGTYYRPVTNSTTAIASSSTDPNVYKLNNGDTTHARILFEVGTQTFTTIDDATGEEKLWSSRSITDTVNTGRNLYLFAKNDSDAGTPETPAASRFYWLKIWQGNPDGSNMRLVRYYRPVKLTNGHVVLWDSVEKKMYRPQSTTAPYAYTTFPVVGSDGAEIAAPFTIVVR